MSLDGVDITSGDTIGPIELNTGVNEFVIAISEDDMLPREYIVLINRADVGDVEGEIPYELANIWTPRWVNPAFAQPADTFDVEVRAASLPVAGWTAELRNDIRSWDAEVTVRTGKVYYGREDGYIFTVTVPDDISPELFSLVLINNQEKFITSANCLKVVQDFEEDFYILHISDEHVMRPKAEHPNGSSHPDPRYNNGSIEMVNWATDSINIINPRFVLHTGDNVQFWHESNSTQPLETVGKPNLINYRNAKLQYKVPTLMVGGNHDTGYTPQYILFDEWHEHYEKVMGQRAFSLRLGSFYVITSEWTIDEHIQYSKDQLAASFDDPSIKFRLWASHYYDGLGKPRTIMTEEKPIDLGLIGHGHKAQTVQETPFPVHMTASGLSGMEHSFYNFNKEQDGSWICPQITSRENGIDRFKFFEDWGTNPIVSQTFESDNNGTQTENKVSILNRVRQNFYDGRVRFLMQKGEYEVEGGTILAQYDYDGNKTAVVVQVDIAPAISDSEPVTTEISIKKAEPKPLFEDDFEDGASNWTVTSGGWSIVNVDGSNQYEKDDNYSNTTIGFAVLRNYISPNGVSSSEWTDYSVEADMTIMHKEADFRAELSARFHDNNRRYSFALMNNLIQIRKRNTGEGSIAQKTYPIEEGKNYHVRGVLVGNKLEMWVNGVKELEVVDDGLRGEPVIENGTIALNTYKASVQYDNVKVIDAADFPPEEPEPPVTDIILDDLIVAEDMNLENTIQLTPDDNVYSAEVPFDTTEIYLMAVVNSSAMYSLHLEGKEITSGSTVGPIELTTGDNRIVLEILEDGRQPREYIVLIKRASIVDIEVDPSNILVTREGPNPAGLCLSYVTDSDLYERKYTMEEVIKNHNFGTIRWPMGTLAMYYAWNSMDEDGNFHYPIEPRYVLPDNLYNNFPWASVEGEPGKMHNEMNFDEFLTLAKNTGATPVVCVNVGGDLYPGATIDYDELKKLAAEQVRYAKEQGLTGIYWEIGNEVEFVFDNAKLPHLTEAQRVQMYIDRYHEFYDVMIAEDPTAKIGVGLNLAAQKDNWQMPVIEGCKDIMDFVVTHQYGGHHFTGAGIPAAYEGYLNNDYSMATHAIQKINLISSYIDELGVDANGIPYSEKLEIVVSEYSSHRGDG